MINFVNLFMWTIYRSFNLIIAFQLEVNYTYVYVCFVLFCIVSFWFHVLWICSMKVQQTNMEEDRVYGILTLINIQVVMSSVLNIQNIIVCASFKCSFEVEKIHNTLCIWIWPWCLVLFAMNKWNSYIVDLVEDFSFCGLHSLFCNLLAFPPLLYLVLESCARVTVSIE